MARIQGRPQTSCYLQGGRKSTGQLLVDCSGRNRGATPGRQSRSRGKILKKKERGDG
jgi:hypothetical protein